jgi:hypothetical protein
VREVRVRAAPRPRHAYTAGVTWEYQPEVLEELKTHGLAPTPSTDPQFVRDYLSALYKYEIRRLKRRLLEGHIPQQHYADVVRLLRKQYVLLSIPLETWTRGRGREIRADSDGRSVRTP